MNEDEELNADMANTGKDADEHHGDERDTDSDKSPVIASTGEVDGGCETRLCFSLIIAYII